MPSASREREHDARRERRGASGPPPTQRDLARAEAPHGVRAAAACACRSSWRRSRRHLPRTWRPPTRFRSTRSLTAPAIGRARTTTATTTTHAHARLPAPATTRAAVREKAGGYFWPANAQQNLCGLNVPRRTSPVRARADAAAIDGFDRGLRWLRHLGFSPRQSKQRHLCRPARRQARAERTGDAHTRAQHGNPFARHGAAGGLLRRHARRTAGELRFWRLRARGSKRRACGRAGRHCRGGVCHQRRGGARRAAPQAAPPLPGRAAPLLPARCALVTDRERRRAWEAGDGFQEAVELERHLEPLGAPSSKSARSPIHMATAFLKGSSAGSGGPRPPFSSRSITRCGTASTPNHAVALFSFDLHHLSARGHEFVAEGLWSTIRHAAGWRSNSSTAVTASGQCDASRPGRFERTDRYGSTCYVWFGTGVVDARLKVAAGVGDEIVGRCA